MRCSVVLTIPSHALFWQHALQDVALAKRAERMDHGGEQLSDSTPNSQSDDHLCRSQLVQIIRGLKASETLRPSEMGSPMLHVTPPELWTL
jgi:hypothetical protein